MKNITLKVSKGEVLVIAGPTGSGKSTLCYILCGIIPKFIPAKVYGKVYINGRDVNEIPQQQLLTTINALLQDPEAQLALFSVSEEIMFPLENLGIPRDEADKRLKWVVDLTYIRHLLSKYVNNLSYGEKQRVALASVLALKPKILILDEPLAHQDYLARKRIITLIDKLREEGITIIVTEHRILDLVKIADRVVVLSNGEVIYEGDIEKLVKSNIPTKIGLRTLEVCSGYNKVKKEQVRSKIAIKVHDLSYAYGSREVLHGISFEVYEGEKVFIVGPNGSGKSTLGMCIAGILTPKRGYVKIMSRDVHKLNWKERVKLVGYVFQNPDLMLTSDSVSEEIRYGLNNLGLKREELDKRLNSILNLLGLETLKDRDPHMLSRGERMIVAIASLLAFNPRVLVLDEPFSGQDGNGVRRIFSILNKIISKLNTTVLIITHDIDLINVYADRVIALNSGYLLFKGTPERALEYLRRLNHEWDI